MQTVERSCDKSVETDTIFLTISFSFYFMSPIRAMMSSTAYEAVGSHHPSFICL